MRLAGKPATDEVSQGVTTSAIAGRLRGPPQAGT